MNKLFYPKLAAGNIKKNGKTYIPYIFTSILTVAMFYIIRSLSLNEGISSLVGADSIAVTLSLGSWIVGIFAVVFLFYTNSFLMKQRKRSLDFTVSLVWKRSISQRLSDWKPCISLL